MKACEFSEFSYGFALTDSLLATIAKRIGSAPVFPSLIQEGKVGGGYDVKIPASPVPIFLQFKIPQVLVRRSKHMPSGYVLPYYRMPLRTKQPNQHQMLLTLEADKPEALILYASPLFHEIADLDDHFIGKLVHAHSAFIEPSRIGALDDKPHHVSYQPNALSYWRHSEATEIGMGFDFESAFEKLSTRRAQARQSNDVLPLGAAIAQTRQRNVLVPLLEALRDLTLADEDRARPFYPFPDTRIASTALVRKSSVTELYKARRKIIDERLFDTQTADTILLAKRVAYVAQVNFGLTFALVDALDTTAQIAG